MDEEEVEEIDNKKDFDVEYDPLAASSATASSATVDVDITMIESKSFVSTQGWDSEMVVDYRINEEEFHKISLSDCDFFIRKPPDPDNDVYDFREVSGVFCLLLFLVVLCSSLLWVLVKLSAALELLFLLVFWTWVLLKFCYESLFLDFHM